MNNARWSLASRLTKLFAITTSALVLATTALCGWYVWQTTEQGLESLLREELDEMRGAHDFVSAQPDTLAEAATEFAVEHPDTPLSWRIWKPGTFETYGRAELFEGPSLELGEAWFGKVQDLGGDLRGMVKPGNYVESGEKLFGCVVDGGVLLGRVRRSCAIGLFLVLAAIVTIFIVGNVVVGRVARTLHEVAQSVRNVGSGGNPLDVDVRDAASEVREIVMALQDMHLHVKADAERNRVFTASLAHELRSPIQNLMGETEVALMTHREGAEYRRVLTSHLQELRDLADAVDNLVTICSARKGGNDPMTTRESFDLAPEAKLRLARESGYALARGVHLNLQSRGDTRLYGDREGLLRAMRNLTANAIEWSDAGDQVDVHVTGENGRVVVTVDDAGPGVPDELKDRIFEAFFRGPQAKGRRIGYGLGLAIVRSAVDSQGGEIEVGRSPTGGARFCLRLPRNLLLPPAEETPAPS